jgi:hypothetical protein
MENLEDSQGGNEAAVHGAIAAAALVAPAFTAGVRSEGGRGKEDARGKPGRYQKRTPDALPESGSGATWRKTSRPTRRSGATGPYAPLIRGLALGPSPQS